MALCISSLTVALSSASKLLALEMSCRSSLGRDVNNVLSQRAGGTRYLIEAAANSSSKTVSAFLAPRPLTPLVFEARRLASSTSCCNRSRLICRYALNNAVGSSTLSMAADNLLASYSKRRRCLSLRKTCSRTVSLGEDGAEASSSSSSCT